MIKWALKDGVYELALRRQPCNEIGTEMMGDLERFLEEASASSARALIIHSEVEGGFCAGADLRELYEGFLSRPEREHEPALRDFIDRIHRVMDTLDTLPMTTIGVVHGVCFGGGLELALTCDLLIAERTARFGFPELRLGIIPGFGGIPRLKRDVGNAIVRDLLLTGRTFNAKKAAGIGLVSQVVPSGEGMIAARAAARQASKFEVEAAVTAKRFIKPLPVEELAQEEELFLRLAQTPALRAALRKFVESDDIRPYLP